MSKPNISYDYAKIYLHPEELYHREGWKEDLKDGQFQSSQGTLQMLVGNYVLNMSGITP